MDTLKIYNYAKDNDIKMEDGETYRIIFQRIVESNPCIISLETSDAMGEHLLQYLEKHWDYFQLRVFFRYPIIEMKAYYGFDEEELYHNYIMAMGHDVHVFCTLHKIERNALNEMNLQDSFRKAYKEQYGSFKPNLRTIELIKLLRDHGFNEEYLKFLEEDIKISIERDGDKYFIKQDLTDKQNIRDLYRVIGEIVGFPEYRRSVFRDYDGYGNVKFMEW